MTFPLLVLALTFSPAQTGLVGAPRGLPFAVFCLPAGALVDCWDRRKVMGFCDTGRAIALASIPVALWCLSSGRLSLVVNPLGLLLTGLLIQGIGPARAVAVLFIPQEIAALAATLYQPLRATPFLSQVVQRIAARSR